MKVLVISLVLAGMLLASGCCGCWDFCSMFQCMDSCGCSTQTCGSYPVAYSTGGSMTLDTVDTAPDAQPAPAE